MDSLFNTKNKFIYIINNNEKQDVVMRRQHQQNLLTEQNLNANEVVWVQSKKLNDFNYEWEDLDYEQNMMYFYKNWSIIFDKFDIRLLAFLDTKIVCRKKTGHIDDERLLAPVQIQKAFQIEDIENEPKPYIKKVTYKISIHLLFYYFHYEPKEMYETKLKLFFPFPRTY